MARVLVAACGTWSGYTAHRRRGEDACDACKAAAATYRRQQRHRNGETKRPSGKRHGTRYGADRVLLPPPASLARCRRGCGRLVWHFDRGLCGACAKQGMPRLRLFRWSRRRA